MESHIFWILKLKVKPGQQDNLKALMSDMVAATKTNEPDALQYEWFINDDGSQCQIHETYKDDAAVLKHLSNFSSQFAERFLGILEPLDFEVYGNPGEEVKTALKDLNPKYMSANAGFVR